MKIAIVEASATQVAEYASTRMGIECHFKEGKDKILAKMAAVGFTGAEIEIEPPEVASEPKTAAGEPAQAKAEPRKLIKILIPTQNEPGGKEPVVVGVNGRVARIVRGKPVDVPEEYVHALQNANKVVYDKDENGSPINPTLVPTHPFSILGHSG